MKFCRLGSTYILKYVFHAAEHENIEGVSICDPSHANRMKLKTKNSKKINKLKLKKCDPEPPGWGPLKVLTSLGYAIFHTSCIYEVTCDQTASLGFAIFHTSCIYEVTCDPTAKFLNLTDKYWSQASSYYNLTFLFFIIHYVVLQLHIFYLYISFRFACWRSSHFAFLRILITAVSSSPKPNILN